MMTDNVFLPGYSWGNTFCFPPPARSAVFLTPTLMIGVIPIHERISAIIGVGYQFAVSPKLTRLPVPTPVYDSAWIVSGRLLF
jgi:hypothetical protein